MNSSTAPPITWSNGREGGREGGRREEASVVWRVGVVGWEEVEDGKIGERGRREE